MCIITKQMKQTTVNRKRKEKHEIAKVQLQLYLI